MNHLIQRFHPRFGVSFQACRWPRILGPAGFGWCAVLCGITCRMPLGWAEDPVCPYLRMHTADEGIVAAVNAIIPADIPVPTAARIDCAASRLPASRGDLMALLPVPHRRLVGECTRGRIALKRGLTGFDLLSLVEEVPDQMADTATIREFFDDRAVDVAVGRACSEGPYPIAFDWAAILDRDSHTLYSFILNCSD